MSSNYVTLEAVRSSKNDTLIIDYVEHKTTKKRYLLKTSKRDHVMTPDERKQLEDEAAAMKRLEHGNVVKFHESFAEGYQYFIVFGCDGKRTLKLALRQQQKPFDDATVVKWAGQLLSAVDYCHSQKVMHRDINPENIFLSDAGDVKLGGFSCVKLTGNSGMAEDAIGTTYYMAPEVITLTFGSLGSRYDLKIDEWSVGVVIFEVATLTKPFMVKNKNPADLVKAICDVKFHNPPALIRSDIARRIVEKLLVKEVKDRASASSLLNDEKALKPYQNKAVFADYTAIEEIGFGAFCKAFKAKVNSTGVICVIKILKSDQVDVISLKNARNEVLALQRLNHPNIVRLLGNWENGNDFGIALEYCAGGDLGREIAKAKAPFKDTQVLRWGCELMSAIDCIHTNDFIHRDIKPENIFLSGEMAIKLGDFNVVKILETNSAADTKTGQPVYMAPEIYDTIPYNRLVDEWSAGVVLFQLATLKLPFENKGKLQLKLTSGVFDNGLETITSSTIRNIVAKLLVHDPRKRSDAKTMIPIFREAMGDQPLVESLPVFDSELEKRAIKDSFDISFDLSPKPGLFGKTQSATNKETRDNGVLKTRSFELLKRSKSNFESLKQEVVKMIGLKHQSLIQIRLHCMTDSNDYAIFEDHGRKSLASLFEGHVTKATSFAEADIWPLKNAIASALTYLQENAIIHGDVQPTNIFLRSTKKWMLGDNTSGFLVKQMSIADIFVSRPATVSYLSPEIIKNGSIAWSLSSNAWALGCILYEAVSLKKAFPGSSGREIADKVNRLDYAPIQNCSFKLAKLIASLLKLESDRTSMAEALAVEENN